MEGNGGERGVTLKVVLDCLLRFAPLKLAESWDNVGLLVEPEKDMRVKNILLTNDLTEDVLDEAISKSTDLIISYHPSIFPHIKSLKTSNWKEQITSKCIRNGIAVFSPHTSWDTVKGGVNDWLAEAFDVAKIKPIIPSKISENDPQYLVTVSTKDTSVMDEVLVEKKNKWVTQTQDNTSSPVYRYTFSCACSEMGSFLLKLRNVADVLSVNSVPYTELDEPATGIGRMCYLRSAITIRDAVEKIKRHLRLDTVQIGLARGATLDSKIKTLALCAGSGTSVLKEARADLKFTGETTHHAVLDAIHNGCTVILTHHSNSERGFLPVFAKILQKMLNTDFVTIDVSTKDKDPLSYI